MKVSNDGKLYTLQYNNDEMYFGTHLYQSSNKESFSNPITFNTYINSGDIEMTINGSSIYAAWIEASDENKIL